MDAKNKITLDKVNNKILYNGEPADIIANRSAVKINCTSVDIIAIKELLARHERSFCESEIVILQKNTNLSTGLGLQYEPMNIGIK